MPVLPPLLLMLLPCTATDGDTINCGGEAIRLLAIDAPELPGHCRRTRRCAPGDPIASRTSLTRAIEAAELRIRRTGRDRYGRTLAQVTANGEDLSCRQLRLRHAIAKPGWDWHRLVLPACAPKDR